MESSLAQQLRGAPWNLVSGYHDGDLVSLKIDALSQSIEIVLQGLRISGSASDTTLRATYRFTGVTRFECGEHRKDAAFALYAFPQNHEVDSFDVVAVHNGVATAELKGMYGWCASFDATGMELVDHD